MIQLQPLRPKKQALQSQVNQLANQLDKLIRTKQLPEGYKLPGIRQLAVQLKCSSATVIRAYRVLVLRGLVMVKRYQGCVVINAVQRLQQRNRLDTLCVIIDQLLGEAHDLDISYSQLITLITSQARITGLSLQPPVNYLPVG